MMRVWDIHIPIRPKAVQSTRFGRNCYPDKRVVAWKRSIIPYIDEVCSRLGPPTELPVRVVQLHHVYKYPKGALKRVRQFIDSGGIVPVQGNGDVTDNLNKGLIDCCAGRVFVNDCQIWHMDDVSKVYGPADGIHIILAETPDLMLIDGTRA